MLFRIGDRAHEQQRASLIIANRTEEWSIYDHTEVALGCHCRKNHPDRGYSSSLGAFLVDLHKGFVLDLVNIGARRAIGDHAAKVGAPPIESDTQAQRLERLVE